MKVLNGDFNFLFLYLNISVSERNNDKIYVNSIK